MTTTQIRVIQSIGDPGKWQAQYYDPSMALWFDIGDAQTDKAEADQRAASYYRLKPVVGDLRLDSDGEVRVLVPRPADPSGEPNVDEYQIVRNGDQVSVFLNGDELVHPDHAKA